MDKDQLRDMIRCTKGGTPKCETCACHGLDVDGNIVCLVQGEQASKLKVKLDKENARQGKPAYKISEKSGIAKAIAKAAADKAEAKQKAVDEAAKTPK